MNIYRPYTYYKFQPMFSFSIVFWDVSKFISKSKFIHFHFFYQIPFMITDNHTINKYNCLFIFVLIFLGCFWSFIIIYSATVNILAYVSLFTWMKFMFRSSVNELKVCLDFFFFFLLLFLSHLPLLILRKVPWVVRYRFSKRKTCPAGWEKTSSW